MSDIFKEVDEALQQEKIKSYWDSYGNLIIGLVLIMILGTAAWSGYQYYDRSIAEEKTEKLLEMTESPENFNPENIEALDAPQNILARMILARKALRAEEAQAEIALEHYREVLESPAAPKEYRALAGYYARQLLLEGVGDLSEFDALSIPKQTIWQPMLDYQTALHQAQNNKDLDAAIKILDEILARQDLPPPLQRQAEIARRVYVHDQGRREETDKGDQAP
jgi:hypothetical protein